MVRYYNNKLVLYCTNGVGSNPHLTLTLVDESRTALIKHILIGCLVEPDFNPHNGLT